MNNTHISQAITIFHGRQAPERGILVGYGAIIDALKLQIPFPERLTLISEKTRRYNTKEWQVFTPRHQPQNTLYSHLVFAIKYEGINLLFFKKLFITVGNIPIEEIIRKEPKGILYSRKIWFFV